MQARLMNVVWGVWMVISVFMWPHSEAQFVNAWILLFESNGATVWNHTVMGLLIATASLLPLTGGTAGREPRRSRA